MKVEIAVTANKQQENETDAALPKGKDYFDFPARNL